MSGLGSDELDPQESQEKRKKSSKKVPAQEKNAKPKPKPKAKPKAKSKQTKNIDTANMDVEEKTPDAEDAPQTSKKRRAKAKTNAQTLKQGHYIDSKQNLCLGKHLGIFCVSDGFVVHLIL